MSFSLLAEKRAWERHSEYERWQDAIKMRMIFGDKHLNRVPTLPREYAEEAVRWLAEETMGRNFPPLDNPYLKDVRELIDKTQKA